MTDKQFAAGYEFGFQEGYCAGLQDGFAKGYDTATKEVLTY